MKTFRMLSRSAARATAALAALASLGASALAAEGDLGGNRCYYERYYAGEMSAAHAFVETVVKKGKWVDRADKLVIVDVRDATEYAGGHPDGAIHVPFPRAYQACKTNPANTADPVTRTVDGGTCLHGAVTGSSVSMTPEGLFLAIEALFPDKAQRIALLCRTGSRSVRAGNILSNPEKYLGAAYAGRGYARVYNIWEGFVGQPMVAQSGPGRVIGPGTGTTQVTLDDGSKANAYAALQLDVNDDGKVDIHDNDGWRFHQGLPYDTRMLAQLLNATAYPYYSMP